MSTDGRPDLSAILITPGRFEAIRKALEHVRHQNVRDRIEVVIVAPSEAGLELESAALEGFWGWQVVEVGEIDNLGPAEAAGVVRARGDAVVYVEEHSFPAAGWAEALIRAHAEPWAAVGPAITNANPQTMISWTTFFLDFGDWVAPGTPGRAETLPSHQTSYKRDFLVPYGERLGRLLETETTLQIDLRARGHELYFEPAARTDHLNVSRFDRLIGLQFQNYREFAANRALLGGWSLPRRLLYIGGSPLIPLVRGLRIVSQIRRAGLGRKLFPGVLPSLVLGLVAAAVGELVGYSVGKGDSSQKRITFELERLRHTSEKDRPHVGAAE